MALSASSGPLRELRDPGGHLEVDEPAPQVVVPHEPVDPAVVVLRDQDAQRKGPQELFESRLPRRLLAPHADQLAGKRDLRLRDPRPAAYEGAQVEVAPGDVARAGTERTDLLRHLIVRRAQRVQLAAERHQTLPRLGGAGNALGVRCGETGAIGAKVVLRRHGQPDLRCELVVAGAGRAAFVAPLLEVADLLLDLLQAHGGAVGRSVPVERVAFLGQPRDGLVRSTERQPVGSLLLRQALEASGQKAQGFPRKEGGVGLDQLGEALVLRLGRPKGRTMLEDRGEQGELLPCLFDLEVARQQVVVALVQGRESLLEPLLLEHVGPDELVEISQHLDADGLREQRQGLLGPETELAAERLAVLLKAVVDPPLEGVFDAALPVARFVKGLQVADRNLGRDQEVYTLKVAAGEPAHLRERERSPEGGVAEHPREHRVRVALAQVLGALPLPLGILEVPVGPQHVRELGALALELGAGGLVVVTAGGRDQERDQGVDERRLSRAVGPREQARVAARLEAVDAAVKAAPVEQLKALEAVAFATAVVLGEQGGLAHARCASIARLNSSSRSLLTLALTMRLTSYSTSPPAPPEPASRRKPSSTTWRM